MKRPAAFCLWCGAPLEVRLVFGAARPACTACDYIHFQAPAAAVCVAVFRRREVLLVRRGIRPYLGQWGLPGGFQDYGEEPQEAARREVLEETGVEIEIRRLLDVFYTRDDPRKRVNVVAYLASPVAGELRAADDASDARFFDVDALPEQIAFENNRILFERLRREHPTGDIL